LPKYTKGNKALNNFEHLKKDTKATLAKNLLSKGDLFCVITFPEDGKPICVDNGFSPMHKMKAIEELGKQWELPIEQWTSLWRSLNSESLNGEKESNNGSFGESELRQAAPAESILKRGYGWALGEAEGEQSPHEEESEKSVLTP
jgi:hypothetical protein